MSAAATSSRTTATRKRSTTRKPAAITAPTMIALTSGEARQLAAALVALTDRVDGAQ